MRCKFHHVHIVCKDLEGMIRFFTETLGASLVLRRKFGTADGASLSLGGTTINLRVPRDDEKVEASEGTPLGYHHIGVEMEDFEGAYNELVDRGFRFYTEPQEAYGIRYAFFKGPEDLEIELVQRLSK
jgi:catechol 2,3-dioxygenase-like lactoylglutathione lyase family enzyme